MTKAPILMSAENPTGWKLEDLLAQLRDEIVAKTNKIRDDDRPVAQLVTQNNRTILQYLTAAENLQRDSIVALAAVAPDPGPTGRPRVGIGSDGFDVASEQPDPLGR
ncbi:hypothetical protein J2J97_31740 (plasmid) [Rhizobium bangladeshense]|uniref:hypothetical protein n=1 Tax=Rhizobium bangladeshense TaxID=1138189 RepID=UPI001A9998CD|nr:hypothetical protein [Rhizobium bangladeshense]QSY98644.1 hypothetical protein J2J97_31740 [Rhizobium bangladeshense]